MQRASIEIIKELGAWSGPAVQETHSRPCRDGGWKDLCQCRKSLGSQEGTPPHSGSPMSLSIQSLLMRDKTCCKQAHCGGVQERPQNTETQGQCGQGACTHPGDLNFVSETGMVERTNSGKLSSNLHSTAHAHTHIQINKKKKRKWRARTGLVDLLCGEERSG